MNADRTVPTTMMRTTDKIDPIREAGSVKSWLQNLARAFPMFARAAPVTIPATIRLQRPSHLDLTRFSVRFGALPDEERHLLLLVVVDGYSYREAADHLNLDIAAVPRNIARARRKLRRQNELFAG